jgi:hypothetical protein
MLWIIQCDPTVLVGSSTLTDLLQCKSGRDDTCFYLQSVTDSTTMSSTCEYEYADVAICA